METKTPSLVPALTHCLPYVVVAIPPLSIAINTKIIGVASIVKACNACEIESQLAHSTTLAPHTSGFHDVVQCEDFLEIQATILVAIQTTEKVRVCKIVAGLPEELDKLIIEDSVISIYIH